MASVHLVRHADAGDREAWDGPDRLRPLTERGWRQAAGLVEIFGKQPVDRILSSPYTRCRQTIEPLAEDRRMAVENQPLLAEGTPWTKAFDLILSARGDVVMCSQGDVITDIVRHLVETKVIKSSAARWKKGSRWTLTVKDGRVTKARYTKPLEVATVH